MAHPNSIQSYPKPEPPPPPGNTRTPKKAKTNEAPGTVSPMDADFPPLPSKITPSSGESQETQDFVPETQEEQLNAMAPEDQPMHVEKPMPSFKDKLLSSGDPFHQEEEEEELVIRSADITIGMNGSIPTIDFASHIMDALSKRMGYTVIVKLLGCSIGYRQMRTQLLRIWKPKCPIQVTDLDENCFLVKFKDDLDFQSSLINGPWMIFGHYLSVQPWSPSFNPQTHKINEIVAWIRLPKLPAMLYHKNVIRNIGSLFGEVIKVDYNTESGDRGKFARLAVLLDLTKPLTSKLQVNGQTIYVEYEALPTICFNCGRYGHVQESCPVKEPSTQGEQPENAMEQPENGELQLIDKREETKFGGWMVVQQRRRPNGMRRQDNTIQTHTGSRYALLQMEEPQNTYEPDMSEFGRPLLSGEPSIWKKKSKDPKTPKKTDNITRPKEKLTIGPMSNLTKQYQTAHHETSLDPAYNTAITITNPRTHQMPHQTTPIPSPLLPAHPINQPTNPTTQPKPPDKPNATGGVKIQTGLRVSGLNARSNDAPLGASIKAMKALAREMKQNFTGDDMDSLLEGVDFSSEPSL